MILWGRWCKKMLKLSENLFPPIKGPFKKSRDATGDIGDLRLQVRNQFEKLKSTVILGASAGGARTILFSSYNHGEGTSTIVANLAACLAQEKKYRTLVIDANTRSPKLDKIMNDSASIYNQVFSRIVSPDVSDPISMGTVSHSNFFFMSCGETSYHPAQAFDHTRFSAFLNKARESFDFMLFDSSPIGKYYDSIVVASQLDGVVLVVQAEKTPSHHLKRAQEALKDKNISVLGVVLNKRRFHIPGLVFDKFLT